MKKDAKGRVCAEPTCDGDCTNCRKEEGQSLDISKLSQDELKTLYKTQSDLVEALVNENELLVKQQSELSEKIEKGNAYLEQLVHLKNDFDNYKRRNKNVAEDAREEGKLFVVEKIIPILDTFSRAEESLKGKAELEPFKMVCRQFDKILSEIGVTEVDVLGQEFDPNISAAVMKEDAGAENIGKVIEVLSKGFKYNEKIVRYSQVKVGY